MIRPSPNELERLRNEEIAKRRLIRLKEVREYSKANASKLRNLYKEQKIKVINKIAQTIQEKINLDDARKLDELKLKHSCQMNSVGNGHNNASDWVDPSIKINEQLAISQTCAEKRHQMALKELQEKKKEKESTENARLKAMQLAMLIEKERAAEIANLPPPDIPIYLKESMINSEDITPRVKVCDRNKFSVIESFENASYNVQRMNSDDQIFSYDADNAKNAAELRQNEMIKMSTNLHIQAEEQFIKAHLRGHKAIKKQLVHKDYQELVSDLEHVAKGEMAKRQREYHKNELIGPNSAGHFGVGHNAAMIMFKEKCRERAVEAAVMDSLKDITNCAKQNINELDNKILSNEVTIDNSNLEPQHKLSRLYDKIRKQKENVRFQEDIPHSPSVVVEEETESAEINKNQFCSSFNFNEPQNIDINCDRNTGEPNDNIIQHTLSVTGRSNIVLEKSTRQKERHHLEDNVLQTDKRFQYFCHNFHEPRDTTSVLSESTIEINSQNEIYNSANTQESNSYSIGSQSLDTQETESVSKIRDFQRKAIMKLNGQLNMSQLVTLEKQISNFSIDSSSVAESLSNSLRSHKEINNSESNHTKTVVSEWVNNQLLQTVEQIPEWVTRSNPKFIPDVNVSFTRSILSIKSTDSSSKSVSSNLSSTTVASPKSSCNFTVQPSLTEISNELNYSVRQQILSNNILSKNEFHSSKEMLASFQSQILINESDKFLPDTTENQNSLPTLNDEAMGDLIDFQSMEGLNVSQNLKFRNLHINQPLLSEINTLTNSSTYFSESQENEVKPIRNHSNLNLTVSDDYNFNHGASNSNLSEISSTLLTVKQCEGDNAKLLINEYEQFLNNIVQKIDSSVSESDSQSTKNALIDKNSNEFQSFTSFYSKDVLETNSVKDNNVIRSETSNFFTEANFSGRGDIISVQHDNKVGNLNNKNSPTYTVISDNILLNSDRNDIIIEQNQSNKIENEIHSNKVKENSSISVSNKSDTNLEIPILSSTGSIVSVFTNNNKTLPEIDQSFVPLESFDTLNDINVLLKPCSDKLDLLSSCNDGSIPLSAIDYNVDKNFERQKASNKKIQNILSSTMKPNKMNVLPSSPDISSICSESSAKLKQQIMKDYFEKNKERLQEVLFNEGSIETSSKPTEFVEDETPRNPDSGKASSRYTVENSGQSTARMTNDDIFITPRNDSLSTEYTVRNEWSTSHSDFQSLSEMISAQENKNSSNSNENECSISNLSEKIWINNCNLNTKASIDLIDFNSTTNFHEISASHSIVVPVDILCSNVENQLTTPTSQKLSTVSNILSSFDRNLLDDNQFSDKSTTECTSSSYKCLKSFNSSVESVFNGLFPHQTEEFEMTLQSEYKNEVSCSIDSKSDADTSNLSLVSFLRNEFVCQNLTVSERKISCESTPKKVAASKANIENNQEMKIQLEKWKKERLLRINNHPPSEIKKSHITKDGNMRRKDNTEEKKRTLKLWNQLEEVQKMKQQKESEKLKIDNQLRKKEYAEKLRRIKIEKIKQVE